MMEENLTAPFLQPLVKGNFTNKCYVCTMMFNKIAQLLSKTDHQESPDSRIKAMNDLLLKLKKAMRGYNFEVSFHVDVYDYCINEVDFRHQFKLKHPKSKVESLALRPISASEFWEELNEALAYRGDIGAGLILSEKNEKRLEELQAQYKMGIQNFINESTQIYYYPDYEGLPIYPVYWEYGFVLVTDSFKYIFICAAASD